VLVQCLMTLQINNADRCKQWNWQGNGLAFAQAGIDVALVSRSQEKIGGQYRP